MRIYGVELCFLISVATASSLHGKGHMGSMFTSSQTLDAVATKRREAIYYRAYTAFIVNEVSSILASKDSLWQSSLFREELRPCNFPALVWANHFCSLACRDTLHQTFCYIFRHGQGGSRESTPRRVKADWNSAPAAILTVGQSPHCMPEVAAV